MVKHLLQSGADPLIPCNGMSPIELAAAATRDVAMHKNNKHAAHFSFMTSASAAIARSLPIFEVSRLDQTIAPLPLASTNHIALVNPVHPTGMATFISIVQGSEGRGCE